MRPEEKFEQKFEQKNAEIFQQDNIGLDKKKYAGEETLKEMYKWVETKMGWDRVDLKGILESNAVPQTTVQAFLEDKNIKTKIDKYLVRDEKNPFDVNKDLGGYINFINKIGSFYLDKNVRSSVSVSASTSSMLENYNNLIKNVIDGTQNIHGLNVNLLDEMDKYCKKHGMPSVIKTKTDGFAIE